MRLCPALVFPNCRGGSRQNPNGLVTVRGNWPALCGPFAILRLPVFPGRQGWSCPLAFPPGLSRCQSWSGSLVFPRRFPLFEGFGFHRRVTKFFTVLKKVPLMETRQRLHTAILDSLRSFPHVIVLAATREFGACLSRLSERFSEQLPRG